VVLEPNALSFMTDLKKPIHRRTEREFAHYKKRIVVSLEPGDVLAMRLEGERTTFRAFLADVYRVLAGWHADRAVAKRRETRRMNGKAN
jgi:hypothetical protein